MVAGFRNLSEVASSSIVSKGHVLSLLQRLRMGPRLALAFLLLVALLGVNDLFGPADRNIANLEEALKGMSGSVAGQLSAFNGPLYSTVDPISGKISELIELQLRVAVEVHQAFERPFQRALWVTSAVALVAVPACLRWAFLVSRSITQPITKDAPVAQGIASGDLSVQCQSTGRARRHPSGVRRCCRW
jgi:hypothetical protein